MKHILLLGATGTAGKKITEKLVKEAGYHITLVARHTKSISIDSPNSSIIQGDASKLEELKKLVANQDVVYCAISGDQLPKIAKNLVTAMNEQNIHRLIFMGAIGIYNEIPDEIDGKDNVKNNPGQIPNRDSVAIIEESNLNYTIVRPGFLREGDQDDFVLTKKGEMAKGHITTLPSLVELASKLIAEDHLFNKESISITRDETK